MNIEAASAHAIEHHQRLRWLLLGGGGLAALLLLASLGAQRWWMAVPWLLLLALVLAVQQARIGRLREQLIDHAPMPLSRPDMRLAEAQRLNAQQWQRAERGLRQFIVAARRVGARRAVAQPSVAVDWVWRTQLTRPAAWRQWCETALGRAIDYREPQRPDAQAAEVNDALRRTWYWACKQERIDPRRPQGLPLLFALDRELAIEGGIHYQADRLLHQARPSNDAARGESGSEAFVHYGSDFGDPACTGSMPGDAAGFGGCESSDSSSSGDGGSSDGGGDGGGGD